ncbi:tetratricopeptide repeat protein [Verrucomicrobiaceae bacterium N1E253]|uniref:Tetratricopeptide repeat protein n=1 Tax=Oceaniferula marina TaxID=2748318 RepID=A0A851GAE7_9BACT|nr:tetratricopeptide repeat protein [Oceaniferula marina]NWK54593.1 tetratricopeptide repeat protein [Oceaniferula marina]
MSDLHLRLRGAFRLLLILVFACFSLPLSAQQQQDPRTLDPSDIFFQAWLTIRDAEKLEKEGNFNDARLKYQQAAKYYQVLTRYHKNWKPHLVEARVTSTQEAIRLVEPKAVDQIAKRNAKAQDLVEGGPAATPNPNAPTGSGHRKATPTASPRTPSIRSNPKVAAGSSAPTQPRPTPTKPTSKATAYSEAIQRGQQRQLEKLQRDNARLQEQLKQAQAQAKNAQSDEQKRLINKIATKDREIATIRNLLARAPLQADLDRLEKENRTRKAELEITALSLKGTRERMAKEQAKAKKSEEEAALAKRRAEEIQKQMSLQGRVNNEVIRKLRQELKSVTQILENTRVELGKANAKIANMQRSMDQSKATIAELTKERDALRTERDALAEVLKQNNSDGVRKLISENMRLGKELKESNDRLEYLTKKNNVTQDELLEAKRDLAVAKTRIMRYQQERVQHGHRIQSLESQLRDAEAELAAARSNPEKAASQEEVEILKETVKRLIAAQERRKAAEKLLWEAYQDSKKIIPGIVEAYEDIRKTKVELTDEEKGLMIKQIPDGEFTVPQRVTPEHAMASANAMEKDINLHHNLAERLYVKGRYEAAREILTETDERYPGHFATLCKRGVVELKTKHYIEALDVFNEALTMQENSSYAHYMLGLSNFHIQDFDTSRNAFEQSIELKPGNANAHLYLGILAGIGRRYEQSENHLQEAIKLNPTSAEAYYNLSFLYLNQGKKKDALDAYRKALNHGSQPDPEHERKLGI